MAERAPFGTGGFATTRVFAATRERVWREWTEPERFADWFGGLECEIPDTGCYKRSWVGTRPVVMVRLEGAEDDACGWVYLDTSPRHNRRWCSAAGCGNRNRARRFNQRRRTDANDDRNQS